MSEPSIDPALERKLDAIRQNIGVIVEIAVADAPGGATAAALTAQVRDQNGEIVERECVFLVYASTTEYHGLKTPNANITLDTISEGSVVAESPSDGWWLVKTNDEGLFACNANNGSDQTVWFNAATSDGGADSAASGTVVRSSIPDSAEWAA
jgi:hypothetical protein